MSPRVATDSKRSAMLSAAIGVLVESGEGALSVGSVTSACGLPKSAFYTYFDSKQSLLDSIYETIKQEALLDFVPDPSLPLVRQLEGLVAHLLSYRDAHPARARVLALHFECSFISRAARERVTQRIASSALFGVMVARQADFVPLPLDVISTMLVLGTLSYHGADREQFARAIVATVFPSDAKLNR